MQGKVASAHPPHTLAGRGGPDMPLLARGFVSRLMHRLSSPKVKGAAPLRNNPVQLRDIRIE